MPARQARETPPSLETIDEAVRRLEDAVNGLSSRLDEALLARASDEEVEHRRRLLAEIQESSVRLEQARAESLVASERLRELVRALTP